MRSIMLEYESTAEWACNPDVVVIWLPDDFEAKLQRSKEALETLGADRIVYMYSNSYEFRNRKEDADPDSMNYADTQELEEDLDDVFQPRITGCDLSVYDGYFLFQFPFKYTNDKGFTSSIAVENIKYYEVDTSEQNN